MYRAMGIDDLNIYGSSLAIDLAAIVRARGLSERDLETVQFRRRSVTPSFEDAVTLAANAARPVVEAAGRDRFDLLIVATESGFDYGKPLSAYVQQCLGLDACCRNVEMKYACYGGTAAIHFATSWLRSGAAPGKKALVVMTDLARRHFGDPAELSAGSGAVAVVLAADPRILVIDSPGGYACREVYDVARPTATGEYGNPVLSLAAYLDLLEEAWENYCERSGGADPVDRRFRYMLYHTPLVSLVRQAHGVLLRAHGADVSATAASKSFDRMVAPALGYARDLANIYSGSLYSLLAGLVEHAPELAPGTRVGFFSYGSGSCAEIFAGAIADAARATVGRQGIGPRLAERRAIAFDEYERLVRETEVMLTSCDYEPTDDPGSGARATDGGARLVLRRIRNHHRQYTWVS
jgi:3-hydroxy-3-methylglutaryl CoA synthase